MFLLKLNKSHVFVLPVILLLLLGNRSRVNEKASFYIQSTEYTMIGPCPGDDGTNRAIMEEFLTKEYWSSARQETNTDQLTTSQIHLLQSSEDNTPCEKFNNQYQKAFSARWSDGTVKYDVSYYKAGNHFFVLISLSEPDDPEMVVSGDAYLDVYNENTNLIKGYAF